MFDDLSEKMYEFRKNAYKEHKLQMLFFELTSRCNAKCEHCGSRCGDFIPKDEITLEEIKGVLDDVAKHYGTKDIMIFITGGEPLMRKDFYEIVSYIDKLGFRWGMTSNGMVINEKVAKQLADSHMYSASISIDGPKEFHEKFRKVPGSFEKICKGIKLMQQIPTIKELQVTTCVSKKNIDLLDDVYKVVKDLGIKDWRIIQVDPIGRSKGNDDLLLDGDGLRRMLLYMRDKREKDPDLKISYGCGHYLGFDLNFELMNACFFCFTGVWIASILSNGDIFGCPDIERRPELIQGNIRKDSFVDVWEHRFKNYRSINRTSNSKCKKCPDWKACGGDSFHTWDFENKKPNFCVREKFKDHYE